MAPRAQGCRVTLCLPRNTNPVIVNDARGRESGGDGSAHPSPSLTVDHHARHISSVVKSTNGRSRT